MTECRNVGEEYFYRFFFTAFIAKSVVDAG